MNRGRRGNWGLIGRGQGRAQLIMALGPGVSLALFGLVPRERSPCGSALLSRVWS